MQRIDGSVLLSASDLMRFTGCAHATTLDIARMNGSGLEPAADSDDAKLLQQRGDAHELAHLDGLKAQSLCIVEIEREGVSLSDGVLHTAEALAQGPDIVFQGALAGGVWGGWSDFLEKVERPSALGEFSYEVADTKLKRTPHPKHLLQLVLYSDLLADVQGVQPSFAHVELGDGTRSSFRLADYAAYARQARRRLETFVASSTTTRPIRCVECTLCRWSEHCASVWDAEDSLFNVANISRQQIAKLEADDIDTMEGLAARGEPVRKMAEPTLQRLITQARLQHERKTGAPTYELRSPEPGKGFDQLPAPQPGDMFYDIEGDPHFEGGLEYLHGIWADGQFTAFWGHDHSEEAAALSDLLAWFRARIDAFPDARIYHYAAYEVTALKKLTAKYGIGEAFLDRLLRERRFVDLFAVVRGGIIASEPNYSIKSMEAFYDIERTGEVKTAGGSVVAYEKWRENQDQDILDEIEDYNRIDCVSTELLRDWLIGIRPDGPWPEMGEAKADKEVEEDAEADALRAKLATTGLDPDRQALLFDLASYHKREDKPVYWSIFDSLPKEVDELIDDLNCLGGLIPDGPIEPVKKSFARRFRFPPQETKMRASDKQNATVPFIDGFVGATITKLDRKTGSVEVKVGPGKEDILTDLVSLHPAPPLYTKTIRGAILDAINDQCEAKEFRAVDDLLSRRQPRLPGREGQDILDGKEPVEGTIAAVLSMNETVLPIQGPPGTGKTYVSARAILALVRAGKRVGVSSTSHEAIRNVLLGCIDAHEFDDPGFEIVHRRGDDPEDDRIPSAYGNSDPALQSADIVGGTAFYFSRPENRLAFDYVFVDEAGQVGLANMVAIGTAARNIVMVGDPQQLPQVVQGTHPEPANFSCLDYILDGAATVPAEKGIFLPVTRRMHPDVCAFISQQVYEGRLQSHPDTAHQQVRGTGLPEAGAHFVPVEHSGNVQLAEEEIVAISAAVTDLLTGNWTDREGETRPMTKKDIIVVAPYNVQVNALREALPNDIRVGTVDKFQGQEAPICLVSMTSSSSEDMPRGLDFLLSLNRINVAVSRAKGLALVFGAPRLLEAKCETVEQMRLANTLCALNEHGLVKFEPDRS